MRREIPYQSSAFIESVKFDDGFEAFELCRIAAWKSAQSIANIVVNDPDRIRQVTRVAHEKLAGWLDHNVLTAHHTNWDLLQSDIANAVGSDNKTGLLSLYGVGYPLASAILRVWNPLTFPVVDQHAGRYIRHIAPDARYSTDRRLYRAEGYTAYIRALSIHRDELGGGDSIHRLDQFAMAAGKALVSAT